MVFSKKEESMKNIKKLVFFVAVGVCFGQLDAEFGLPETIIVGACASALVGGIAYHAVTSCNQNYISSVRSQCKSLTRDYGILLDASELSQFCLREFADLLVNSYRPVDRFIESFARKVGALDSAITNLVKKMREWAKQNGHCNNYNEGAVVLQDALVLQRRLHELNNNLQENRDYFVLFALVNADFPVLNHANRYPYHTFCRELKAAKKALVLAICNFNESDGLDADMRNLIDRALTKIRILTNAYDHVVRSAEYVNEKLSKRDKRDRDEQEDRERRDRELLEARKRQEESDLKCAAENRELDQKREEEELKEEVFKVVILGGMD